MSLFPAESHSATGLLFVSQYISEALVTLNSIIIIIIIIKKGHQCKAGRERYTPH